MKSKLFVIVSILLMAYLIIIFVGDVIEENKPDAEKAIAHSITERPVYECWWAE